MFQIAEKKKEKVLTHYSLEMQRASLWAKHSCHLLTELYGCMFIENSPNSLHCPLSKYRMHIFKNDLINCSLALGFPHALLFLSSSHHASVTNRPWQQWELKKKKSENKCDLWVPLKLKLVCWCYWSFWAYIAGVHVSACVLYTMAWVKTLKPVDGDDKMTCQRGVNFSINLL